MEKFKRKINVNFNNKNYIFSFNFDEMNISDLIIKIFSELKIENNNYKIYYNNRLLRNDDIRPIHIYFYDDFFPLLIVCNKNCIISKAKSTKNVTIFSNLNQEKFLKIIIEFFKEKNMNFNAKIENNFKGIYDIKFESIILANEFEKYYNKKMHKIKKIYSNLNIKNEKKYEIKNNRSLSFLTSIKKINNNNNNNKKKREIKSFSTENIINRKIILPKITKKINNKNKKIEPYLGMYLFPFMNPDEKYYKDLFNDKKNWISKKNFILSVGKYKMKENFIPNYVQKTPSEFPLNHKFRETNKKKWLIKNGFYL